MVSCSWKSGSPERGFGSAIPGYWNNWILTLSLTLKLIPGKTWHHVVPLYHMSLRSPSARRGVVGSIIQHDSVVSCCPLARCRVAVSISKIWHHAVPLAPCVVVWSLSTTWCCTVSLHIVTLFHCTVHDVTASLSPSMTWRRACMDAWSFCRTWCRAVCQHHMYHHAMSLYDAGWHGIARSLCMT